MLLPILEIITAKPCGQMKDLKFSYPLNDRALAEGVAKAYHEFKEDQPVFHSTLHKLITQGFEYAEMICNTHIEFRHMDGGGLKAVGFIDIGYHQTASTAIRNTTRELRNILSYEFSNNQKTSNGNVNQDPLSLLVRPHEWLRRGFWELAPAPSSLFQSKATIYSLRHIEGYNPFFNIHNGVSKDNQPFFVLRDLPRSLLTRELAKVYCHWYREREYELKIKHESIAYADLYSKLPFAQVCNKNLIQSIRHYGFDEFKEPTVDRYTVDDFDFTNGDTRVYGWYLHGNNIVIRYMQEGKFRVDQIYLPDYYLDIFNHDYQFNLEGFITHVVKHKLSKLEVRQWLKVNKGDLSDIEIPYFHCIYDYLSRLMDYERLNEGKIHCKDQRIMRWLKHFNFLDDKCKFIEEKCNAYVDQHYGTHSGLY